MRLLSHLKISQSKAHLSLHGEIFLELGDLLAKRRNEEHVRFFAQRALLEDRGFEGRDLVSDIVGFRVLELGAVRFLLVEGGLGFDEFVLDIYKRAALLLIARNELIAHLLT